MPRTSLSALVMLASLASAGCDTETRAQAQAQGIGQGSSAASSPQKVPLLSPAEDARTLRHARFSVMGRDDLELGGLRSPEQGPAWRSALTPIEGFVTYPPTRRDDDQFGDSLDLSGNRAVVGAWATGRENKGAAHVYRRGATSEASWDLTKTLAPSSLAPGDFFGFAVTLNASHVAVSAHRDKEGGEPKGAVYLFDESLVTPTKLRPSDPQRLQEFGFSLAFAGEKLVVGAPGDGRSGAGAGAVYVFGQDGQGRWRQEQKLMANDGQANDLFGADVSATGNRIVIGARGRSIGGQSLSGVAYVFALQGTSWVQEAKLEPSTPTPGGRFGLSVAISGRSILVGAPTFREGGVVKGRVFSYALDSESNWSLVQQLSPDQLGLDAKGFGTRVDIAGDLAVVSDYDNQSNLDLPGSVMGFSRGAALDPWEAIGSLKPAAQPRADGFGQALALSGATVVVGAHYQAENNSSAEAGAMHTFELGPATPAPLLPWTLLVGLGAALGACWRKTELA